MDQQLRVRDAVPNGFVVDCATVDAAHTSISTVTRDRASAYGEAISRALPHAMQVADRWHLMENASSAFLDAVRGSMKQIRSALSCQTIDPKLLTAAERLQYEGWLGRRAANDGKRYERPTYHGSRRLRIIRPNFARRRVGWTTKALMPCIKTCMKPVIIGGSR